MSEVVTEAMLVGGALMSEQEFKKIAIEHWGSEEVMLSEIASRDGSVFMGNFTELINNILPDNKRFRKESVVDFDYVTDNCSTYITAAFGI